MPQHPVQPLIVDAQGVTRFKENAIVRYLLDAGPFDMNHLAGPNVRFSDEDREQFAQLIGYSLCGFGDLSYVSDETYERAAAQGPCEDEPEPTPLERLVAAASKAEKANAELQEAIAALT